MRFRFGAILVLTVALLRSLPAEAQEAKSQALAKQLAAALDAAKLDSIAAADPSAKGVYVGALYISGSIIFAIAASYPSPAALDQKLASKEYRDVYLDLSAMRTTAARFFVEDMGANGLNAKPRDNDPSDNVELEGVKVILDNEPRRQKISAEEYQKAFMRADERYSQMLAALLAQLKKGT